MLPDCYEELYDRTYRVLITAGCDEAQAHAIAKERVAAAQKAADVKVADCTKLR